MSTDSSERLNALNALNAKIDAWAKGPGRKFQCFDPVLTFSDPSNDRFIGVNGKHGEELNPDSEALFDLGREAFARLAQGKPLEKNAFEEGYAFYWSFLDSLRDMLSDAQSIGKLQLKLRNRQEDQAPADLSLLDDGQVISIAWKVQLSLGEPAKSDDFITGSFWQCFLYHALREIDSSRIGLFLDGREAVVAALGAANALSNAISIESGNEKEQEIRRDIAYRGAMEKLKRDPKQAAKAQVRECWTAWQKKPESYKNKSAFAKGMMEKYEELDSQVVITRWCGQWEKEASE